jgi:hypothetical protein
LASRTGVEPSVAAVKEATYCNSTELRGVDACSGFIWRGIVTLPGAGSTVFARPLFTGDFNWLRND